MTMATGCYDRRVSGPGSTLVLSLCAAALLAACASGGTGHGAGTEGAPPPPEWVVEPAGDWDEEAEPLLLQVTGSAAIGDDLAGAERAAQADALAAIGAFLDGAVSELGAEAAPPVSVATAVQSARVRGKFHDGRRFFVRMACDAGLVLPAGASSSVRDELARLVARRNRG